MPDSSRSCPFEPLTFAPDSTGPRSALIKQRLLGFTGQSRHELAAIMAEGVSVVKMVDKIVRCFLAVGFLVPCLLQLLYYLGMPIDRMGEWLLFTLWPAFGFVMASDGGDSGAALGFLMSVVANALLYGLLGVLVSFIYRRFFQRSVVNS